MAATKTGCLDVIKIHKEAIRVAPPSKTDPFNYTRNFHTLNINKAIVTASFIIVSREREREKERIIDQKRRKETDTHTYIHTHTHREREREREREIWDILFFFFFFWVLGLEEKGLGWLIWRAKLVKSLGSERGNHPTMHNLNPLSETVKSVRKKKEKQSPLVLWLRASVCFYLLSRSRNRHWPISVFGPCFKFQTSVVECLKWEKRRVSSSLCFFLKSQAGNKCHSCLSASFILY